MTNLNSPTAPDKRPDAKTGIVGLDDVLAGGFAAGQLFLVEGDPGTGKTTLAMRFLLEGAQNGETCLYVTMSETEAELRAVAASHGWSLPAGLQFFDLVPAESLLDPERQQSLLYASELELGETINTIFQVFERVRPDRIVIDSLSEIRALAQNSFRYRRQVLALKHYFSRSQATVLLLDDRTSEATDRAVHSIVHGVIDLQELAPVYGAQRRRLRVTKYRGRRYRGGYHDIAITVGGVEVYPRLVASEHRRVVQRAKMTTGEPSLDSLLGGGIEQGSSTLVLGPSGTGKSVFILQFIAAAAARGDRSAMFVFDEELGLLFSRAKALGFDLESLRDRELLHIEQLDAAELSPGEFAHRVRDRVAIADARCVVIDSLNGYQAAMPEENALVLHIHELLQYLNRQGAATFLTVAQHGLVGDMQTPVDVTYLADTLLLLRYFEAAGRVRRAVSVIKKRMSMHEDTIREYQIGANGLTLGEPLHRFHGVLRGVPTFVGETAPLLGSHE